MGFLGLRKKAVQVKARQVAEVSNKVYSVQVSDAGKRRNVLVSATDEHEMREKLKRIAPRTEPINYKRVR